jgi:hypothetical protein
MVGEISAIFWASNSSGPRASFLRAFTGEIGGAVIAAILFISRVRGGCFGSDYRVLALVFFYVAIIRRVVDDA